MVAKNNIEKVWEIEENQVKQANKIVSKIQYNGMEIPVLKTEMNCYSQDFLFKDKNNEYWSMNILGIRFKEFMKVEENDFALSETKQYCNRVCKYLDSFDLKNFFEEKISEQQYFNLCELKYISKYYPELFEGAKKSRNIVKEKHKQQALRYKEQAELEKQEKVKTVNDNFEKKLKEIKYKINFGGCVSSTNLEFYKNNDYENGITTQNCFLYLAKQYGIEIPLVTQGFINNKLRDYNFKEMSFCYLATTDKILSTKVHRYLTKISEKVKQEYRKKMEQNKVRNEKS